MVCALLAGPLKAAATDDEPLAFGFLDEPTGVLVSLGSHRLHVECIGKGDVTVLFEPGLGGHALEWQPIQNALADRVHSCTYDRAGYGWSSASPFPRHARQLAREADQLLAALSIDGPLILVGHSFGGFIVRQLAERRVDQMIGMVLVDASHETQFERLYSDGARAVLPRGNHFVLSSNEAPQNLPRTLRRRVAAFARMRKTYAATHGEMASFRLSAEQLKGDTPQVGYPIHVLRRGIDVYAGKPDSARKNVIWAELQNDLARLSTRSQVVVATRSGHHVHVDEPELVVRAITTLLDEHEAATPQDNNLP